MNSAKELRRLSKKWDSSNVSFGSFYLFASHHCIACLLDDDAPRQRGKMDRNKPDSDPITIDCGVLYPLPAATLGPTNATRIKPMTVRPHYLSSAKSSTAKSSAVASSNFCQILLSEAVMSLSFTSRARYARWVS